MSRKESSFEITGSDGRTRKVTLLSHVTPDDLVRVGLKAYMAEAFLGETYESPFSREVRDMIVLSRATSRS